MIHILKRRREGKIRVDSICLLSSSFQSACASGGGGAMHLVIDEGDDVLWCVSTLDRTAGLASRGERGYWR